MNGIARELENARDNLGSIELRFLIRDLLPLDSEQFKDRLENAIVSLCRVRAQFGE
jgi:hypothetical protein